MLEVTLLGHASLLVHGDGTVLCDPIFSDQLSGGGNLIDPPRRIALDRLGEIDAVAITHHHSDHFNPHELAKLPALRDKPFLVPAGSKVARHLRTLGYHDVIEMRAGDCRSVAGLDITATPSNVPFPEIGFRFQRNGAVVLNLADTIIDGVMEQLRELVHRPGLVLAPFQAGGYMSLLPLRIGGPPHGLVEAIEEWSTEYLEQLIEHLTTLAPLQVVPFADGIRYRDESINHWHFPLPDEAFIEALGKHGIATAVAVPGSRFRVEREHVQMVATPSRLIEVSGTAGDRRFDPSCRLADEPAPCPGMVRKRAPDNSTHQLFTSNLRRTLAGKADSAERDRLLKSCAEWQLDLCDVNCGARYWRIDVNENPPTVRPQTPEDSDPTYGIRAHWRDLARVLAGEMPLSHVELSGAFRYISPARVELEAVRHRVLGPLRLLFNTDD